MTPKDKAIELYNNYEQLGRDFTRGVSMKEFAKQCALIAVNEVIANIEPSVSMDVITARIKYWTEVKEEIEKL